MEIIHLRHAQRNPNHKHINQKGLEKSQKIGSKLKNFDLVLTSVSTRAVETCIAMGYTIDDTIDFSLSTKEIKSPQIEMKEGSTYQEYFEEYKKQEYIYRFANNCKKIIIEKLKEFSLNEKHKVLLISHGGVIESSTIAFLPSTDFKLFGKGTSNCEGVKLIIDGNYDGIQGEPIRFILD